MNDRATTKQITSYYSDLFRWLWHTMKVSTLKWWNSGLELIYSIYLFLFFTIMYWSIPWQKLKHFFLHDYILTNHDRDRFTGLFLPDCQFPASAAWRRREWPTEERWAAGWRPQGRPGTPGPVLIEDKYSEMHLELYLSCTTNAGKKVYSKLNCLPFLSHILSYYESDCNSG